MQSLSFLICKFNRQIKESHFEVFRTAGKIICKYLPYAFNLPFNLPLNICKLQSISPEEENNSTVPVCRA